MNNDSVDSVVDGGGDEWLFEWKIIIMTENNNNNEK